MSKNIRMLKKIFLTILRERNILNDSSPFDRISEVLIVSEILIDLSRDSRKLLEISKVRVSPRAF